MCRCGGFSEYEEVDYLIVGVGSAGGVLLQRLARAGFNVVGLEAGPFWDTERDWVSDEAGSHQLYWNDPRVTGGNRSARTRREQLRQRRRRRLRPLGCIHPALPSIGLRSLYTRRRRRGLADHLRRHPALLRTAGTGDAGRRARLLSLGHPHGYPYGPHPMGGVGNALIKGCTRLGIPVSIGGPVAILSGLTAIVRTASIAASAFRAARWAPRQAR